MIELLKFGKNHQMDGKLFLGIRLMQVLIAFRLRLKSMDLLWLLALQMEKLLL
jgi:hypothetical protein